MSKRLEGHHVVIVGGSRGIGAAAAVQAAREGADVSILFRSRVDAAEDVAELVQAEGQRAFLAQMDIADADSVRNAMQESVEHLGAPTGLVVSAGVFVGKPLEEMSVEFWDEVLAVNLRGTFLSVQAAAGYMKPRGGSIVIYSSTAGQRGSAVFSAYATSKAGQIMFMRSMALELAPKIRVNCIAPSWTETEMADASLTALGRESVSKSFPLGRIGLPEDVAKATVFLLSDDAGFITGTTVTVDGGSDMRG